MNRVVLARVLPFAVFMAFIGLEEIIKIFAQGGPSQLAFTSNHYLYPVKTLVVVVLLIIFSRSYKEINLRDLLKPFSVVLSIVAGFLVFFLWIHMDWSFNAIRPTGYDPTAFQDDQLRLAMTGVRLFGAVIVVPVMEELFWRSFLLRYIIDSDFSKVPIGTFTWPSFILSSVLFGLEHHYVFAGIMAGIVYNLLLYRTKSIVQCILAHALTNLLLGIYVLSTGAWHFW